MKQNFFDSFVFILKSIDSLKRIKGKGQLLLYEFQFKTYNIQQTTRDKEHSYAQPQAQVHTPQYPFLFPLFSSRVCNCKIKQVLLYITPNLFFVAPFRFCHSRSSSLFLLSLSIAMTRIPVICPVIGRVANSSSLVLTRGNYESFSVIFQ